MVTSLPLPLLKANNRSTIGKGDIVVGKKNYLEIAITPYEHAYGLIELKTSESSLNPAQNVLELAALAKISFIGKNVALLASDCATKWELCYFKDEGTIQRRAYRHGRKCWEDF